ncbi:MAG: hypothetical protein M3421_08200 [Bacteroidota bacterium]|nr:hypothetical protein [Bacteroidota bacterium]
MRKNIKYTTRKIHRYLGLFLGIQFLLWTLGGLYFSWNDIDDVHGDHLLNDRTYLPANLNLVSPGLILEEILKKEPVDSLLSIQLIEISGQPVYQIRYFSGLHNQNHEGNSNIRCQLADAETGKFINPLNEHEAIEIARKRIKGSPEIEKAEFLLNTSSHHEYRSKPLPAWAITFKDPIYTTVYVAAELGTFQSVRHNQWRIFDFLWMLHTMDYEGRDNFGNILLKIFSIMGLFTVISGFALYFTSSPTIRLFKSKAKTAF